MLIITQLGMYSSVYKHLFAKHNSQYIKAKLDSHFALYYAKPALDYLEVYKLCCSEQYLGQHQRFQLLQYYFTPSRNYKCYKKTTWKCSQANINTLKTCKLQRVEVTEQRRSMCQLVALNTRDSSKLSYFCKRCTQIQTQQLCKKHESTVL